MLQNSVMIALLPEHLNRYDEKVLSCLLSSSWKMAQVQILVQQ